MLSEKIQEWSIWKILIVFNIVALIILIPSLVLFENTGLSKIKYELGSFFSMVYMAWELIPFIIPLIILFFGWKSSLKKLGAEKPENNLKLNKKGKILFWVGIFIIPLAIILNNLIPKSCRVTGFCIEPGDLLFLFLFYIIIPMLLLIGSILWIKSNYGGKNTFKIFMIAIGSIFFQFLALYCVGYFLFEILNIKSSF